MKPEANPCEHLEMAALSVRLILEALAVLVQPYSHDEQRQLNDDELAGLDELLSRLGGILREAGA